MGKDRFTEHAQNLQGCDKSNLRKEVGNLEMPIGCEISVITQEVLKHVILLLYINKIRL